jgi:hypothetical protein
MRAPWFKIEMLAAGTIAVFSAAFLFQTYDYGRRAALFPRLISVAILLLTAIFLVSRLRRGSKRTPAIADAEKRVGGETARRETRRAGMNWLLAFGAASGFSALIYLIGFGPSTFVYVASHLYLAGYRRHAVGFLFALAMATVVVLTGHLFGIQLPRGVLVEIIAPEGDGMVRSIWPAA